MVKVCGRYWLVRLLNIKGICDSEDVCVLCVTFTRVLIPVNLGCSLVYGGSNSSALNWLSYYSHLIWHKTMTFYFMVVSAKWTNLFALNVQNCPARLLTTSGINDS